MTKQKPNSRVVFASQLSLGDYTVFLGSSEPRAFIEFPLDHITRHLFDELPETERDSWRHRAHSVFHLVFDFTAWASMVTSSVSYLMQQIAEAASQSLFAYKNEQTYFLHPAWRCMWTCQLRWWQTECTSQHLTSSPSLSTSTGGLTRPGTDCSETVRETAKLHIRAKVSQSQSRCQVSSPEQWSLNLSWRTSFCWGQCAACLYPSSRKAAVEGKHPLCTLTWSCRPLELWSSPSSGQR